MDNGILIAKKDRDTIMLAKFAIALIDNNEKNLTTSISELNELSHSFFNCAKGLAEAPIIELYRSIFGIYVDAGKKLEDGFLDICTGVFDGIKLDYPIETIYNAHVLLNPYPSDIIYEDLYALYEIANRVTGSILSHIIYRRVLDIEMDSSRFLNDLALVKVLINKLDTASEEVKEASLLIGKDLFFRKPMRVAG